MTEKEILEHLCYYDPRTPDFDPEMSDREPREPECACDNCFYGCDKLAMALLSGTKKEAWVLLLDQHGRPGPYYAQALFCGGTYDLEKAHRFETKPESRIGIPVRVTVVTSVETVTDG